MSKCSKMGRTSVPTSVKPVPRELNHEKACAMIQQYLKPQMPEHEMPYRSCMGCASPTCLSCPEETFVHESVIEQVSDDLSLLRCQLCELNQSLLAKFTPEPWFNKQVILERLMEIRRSLDKTIRMDPSRSVLVDLALVLDLIDRIEDTINDEEDDENGVRESELQD